MEPDTSVFVGWTVYNSLNFINGLVSSIAWPLAIFGIAFLFRSQIRKILTSIKSFKYGEFEGKLEQLEEVALTSNVTGESVEHQDNARSTELFKLAEKHPHSAILEAWRDIQMSIDDLLRRLKADKGIDKDYLRSTPLHKIGYLSGFSVLSPSDLAILHNLREMRNIASHDVENSISISQAYQYVSRARQIITTMDAITYPEN